MTEDVGGRAATERSAPAGLLCPVCRVDLVMSERQGIEIDYCPRCRGVWLDRGELDKIIERGATEYSAPVASAPPTPPPGPRQEYPHGYDRERQSYGHREEYRHHKHRRKSFLEELFD